MTTEIATSTTERLPLSRERILRTALAYIDEHGLRALSMHKLGAELGVKGMSLYNHVANKDDVLDGVVETLWAEVEQAAPAQPDWREGHRLLARSLRDVMQRHPNAAPLLTVRPMMPDPALRAIRTHVTAAIDAGVSPDDAYALLRTITSYALGVTFAYLSWGLGGAECTPVVADLLKPETPDYLAGVAEIFCGQSDVDEQFEFGLDLMLRERA